MRILRLLSEIIQREDSQLLAVDDEIQPAELPEQRDGLEEIVVIDSRLQSAS